MSNNSTQTVSTDSRGNNVSVQCTPEAFSGKKGEDAELWWKRFEKYTTLKRWSKETARDTFPLMLREPASIWFDGLSTFDAGRKK